MKKAVRTETVKKALTVTTRATQDAKLAVRTGIKAGMHC